MEQPTFSDIQTERLVLRRPKEADWETISYLRSDLKVNKFIKRQSAETKVKAIAFITKIRAGIEAETILYWVITEIDSDRMIGSICLWNFSEDRKTAETGYDLHPKFQGKGIMSEALSSVIDLGFNQLGLSIITAYTDGANQSSLRLLERNNFKLLQGERDSDNENNVIYELSA
jgi:ribosomal-protein-alanine N-acetyltransferase